MHKLHKTKVSTSVQTTAQEAETTLEPLAPGREKERERVRESRRMDEWVNEIRLDWTDWLIDEEVEGSY